MSYDQDNVYMVQFESGREIHVGDSDVEGVIYYCSWKYPTDVIKTIYKEVYVANEEVI